MTRLERHIPTGFALDPDFAQRVDRAADHLAANGIAGAPRAVVLGSGLGGFVDGLDVRGSVAFGEIPGVAAATVPGHTGRILQVADAAGDLIVLQGRLHAYEGIPMADLLLPLLAVRALGAGTVVLTNAAGGLHPDMRAGDLALLTGLLDLHLVDPLRGLLVPDGTHANEVTLRAARTGHLFDRALARRIRDAAGAPLHAGTYVSLWGPNYETPLEIGFLREVGGVAVGMSTGPEAAALKAFGARVAGISLITNVAVEAGGGVVTHDEVQAVGADTAATMEDVLGRVLVEIAEVG